MLDRVAQFIDRYQMFQPGQRVGVAVSGGADSVFLLHVLRELAPRWDLRLGVVHIEHGIRGPDSIADSEFVGQLASSLGLPFHLQQADVPAMPGNLEEAARTVRHTFYRELIAAGTVDCIATGHTRSDQAETVLYRILRGSGSAGLSGILPVTRERLVRPLLEIDRCEIETWLHAHSVSWREDVTNRDHAYARNRLRHEIVPLLRAGFNPRLDDALANLATIAAGEEAFWEEELARRLPAQLPAQLPDMTSHQPVVLPLSSLSGPHGLARRLLRRTIEVVKGDLRAIDFAHIERILEMAVSPTGHDRLQIPGLDVCRSFDWVRFAPAKNEANESPDFAISLAVPGSVELPGTRKRITLQVLQKEVTTGECAKVVNELDWYRFRAGRGAPSLELRNWRAGDQYRRVGHSKPEKIKFFFQEARIPLWERGNWPIITYNDSIVWTRRFGAAAEFATGPETRSVLQVIETENELRNRSDRL